MIIENEKITRLLQRLNVKPEAIVEFCHKWKITELALFGSALRDDFRDDSDVDVLVTFAEDTEYSLLDMIEAEDELADIVGRMVDLVQKRAVEKSKNPIRRNHILNHMEPCYVAR